MWSAEVVKASQKSFAFCSTLAVYVYSLENAQLRQIISGNEKTILGLSWNPHNENEIAVTSMESTIVVWDLSTLKQTRVLNVNTNSQFLLWSPTDPNIIAHASQKLLFWNLSTGKSQTIAEFSDYVMALRWCPTNPSLLLAGTKDGHTYLVDLRQKKPKCLTWKFADSIMDLQFDPLSSSYAIVASVKGDLVLLDYERDAVVMHFEKPSGKIVNLAWYAKIPGCFLSTDEKSGIIRVWNVANKHYVDTIRARGFGFRSFFPIPNSDKFVASFRDGAVGVYDFHKKRWEFTSQSSHTETVFDCEFKPSNKNILATCSYDSSIKFWDVTKMENIDTIPDHKGTIYGISWCPGDDKRIASVTGSGHFYVWDSTTCSQVAHAQFSSDAIYRVSWNKEDSSLIALGCKDGSVIVCNPKAELIKKYRLSQATYGVDWSPFEKSQLAVGSHDGLVRIFDVTKGDSPVKILKGHESRSFNVAWNPLIPSILASGSDDKSIIIWNTAQGTIVGKLQGHQNNVRALVWNPAVPYILLSGSWDGTIRIWDTRNFSCLDVIYDHNADVYGLSCHIERPFFYVSTSRDNSIRLWSLDKICRSTQVSQILGTPSDDSQGDALADLRAYPISSSHKLYHTVSRSILGARKTSSNTLSYFKQLFDYCKHPVGIADFFNVLDVCQKKSEADFGGSICHRSNSVKYLEASCHELLASKLSKAPSTAGAMKREDRVRLAASNFLKAGHTQRYCELMVELGEWEKAVSMAPAVSLEYWKSLSAKYATHLETLENDAAVSYHIASGAISKAVDFYTSRGDLADAVVVADAYKSGRYLSYASSIKPTPITNQEESDALSKSTNAKRVLFYISKGAPIMAATCALSADDYTSAISILLKANEIELAAIVCAVLNIKSDETFYKLAMVAEKMDRRDLMSLALKQINHSKSPVAALLGRQDVSVDVKTRLYANAGLESPQKYAASVSDLTAKASSAAEKVAIYIHAGNYSSALDTAAAAFADLVKKDTPLSQLADISVAISGVPAPELAKHGRKVEIFAYVAYVAAICAMQNGYDSVVLFMLSSATKHAEQARLSQSSLPSCAELVGLMTSSAGVRSSRFVDTATSLQPTLSPIVSKALGAWIQLIKSDIRNRTNSTEVVVSGSQLLRYDLHSGNGTSALTKTRIAGPPFVIDLSFGPVSLSEAVMLADVSPFSPSWNGTILNPY
eukprot:TRINITY_DN4105_c0_g1_i5.p1 TRINITY_DN4105_c0_g1~~TRINITY_DN4105_c0_g1_i5.p1  ORF type:complete len:1200 (+),score=232.65 TRINITY_DN4105_c0_g1_i5:718-4317(+)